MKKKIAILITLAGFLAAGNAIAADMATINVSATVLGTCTFDADTYAMNFGNIATTATGDKTASVALEFTCSNGTPWTLDDVAGAQVMTGDDSGTSMDYSIDTYGTTGTGNGDTQTVTITGRIADTDYQVATADVYKDELTININP